MPRSDDDFRWDEESPQLLREMRESPTATENRFVVPELGQIAPAVPVRWIEVEQDEWPYESPEIEYVRSPFPLDMSQLAIRWEGLYKPHQIEAEFAQNDWPRKRFEYQAEKTKVALSKSLANDVEYQRQVVDQDIVRLANLLERLESDLVAGVEYKPVRGAGAFGYVKMPMTVESKAKLSAQIERITKIRGVRVGLADELKKSEKNVTLSLAELIQQNRADRDPNYAKLIEMSGLPKGVMLPSQLPPGAVVKDANHYRNGQYELATQADYEADYEEGVVVEK